MSYSDPQILHMVLILPSLLGLSLLYDGLYKYRGGERGWWLNLFSGLLVLVAVIVLFFIFNNL